MDLFLKTGRYLLVIPIFIFSLLHFFYGHFVSGIVPPWLPWPLFLTYLAGITILAAGVAIVSGKYARQAAILMAAEIFVFIFLIHFVLLFHDPDNTWAERPMFGDFNARLINAFKDFGLCGALFIFAGTQSEQWKKTGKDKVFVAGRLILGISIAIFGLLQYVFLGYAPGIPPMYNSVSFIFAGEQIFSYVTGAIFLVIGVSIVIGKETRTGVTWLAVIILVCDLLVWVPRIGVNPGELHGNWLKDLGILGGVLMLADTLPAEPEFQPFK